MVPMALPGCCFSAVSCSATLPVTRLEFRHPACSSVVETTSLGVLFMKSANWASLPWFGQYAANSS